MKIFTFCWKCSNENNNTDIIAEGIVSSDLTALCECPNGHKQEVSLMHDIHEILYVSGIYSFIKGFYSESIMNFASSLERTYEFFIKLCFIKNNIAPEKIDSLWTEIKLSERQYGAFCCQYLIITNEVWKANSAMVELRNNVIHNGYISDKDDAEHYGKYITESIKKILEVIDKNFNIEKIHFSFIEKEHLQKRTSTIKKS
jgi:hypothetical protein